MKFVIEENARNPEKIYLDPVSSITKLTLSDGNANLAPQRWKTNATNHMHHETALITTIIIIIIIIINIINILVRE